MNPWKPNNPNFRFFFLMASTSFLVLIATLSAQLNDEIGRLIQAKGEVNIVTNDGRIIDAVTILTSGNELGVPIKMGNKVVTSEYSSAIIKTLDENLHSLDEMTSIQFGAATRQAEQKVSSLLKRLGSFFLRQSGKAGDYRTELVNTGWVDVGLPEELITDDK